LSTLRHPVWPAAPFVLELLVERAPASAVPYLPSQSLLPLLGPRIPAADLYDADRHDDEDVLRLELVRAYTLRPLIGAKLMVGKAEDISGQVRRLLTERIPGFDWVVPDDWRGPFERYGVAHKSLLAPPHPETGEPMSVEVFGVTDSPGVIVISAATYANIQFPGYGVDLYL